MSPFRTLNLMFWVLGAGIVLSLLATIDNMFFGGMTKPSNIPNAATQFPQPNPVTPSQPAATPLPQVAPAQDLEAARIAKVRAELWQASKLLAEASIHADQALVQSDAWTRDIEPLLKNDEGRLIRSQDDLVQKMAFLFDEKRPVKQELAQVHDRIVALTSKTDRLGQESAPADLDAQHLLAVTDLHRRAQDAGQVWTAAVDRENAILREAKRRPSDVVAAAQTQPPAATGQLTPPVTQPAQPDTKNDTPKAVASLPPAPSDTLADAVQSAVDKTKIASLAEEQKQREQRAKEQAEKKHADDLEAQRAAEEKAKLIKEARPDEVQRVLQPFLTVRAFQPRLAGASVRMSKTVNMSFTALRNMGALDESLRGLEVLARVGSHRDMNGPKWQYNPSPRSWSQETQEELKHAQELLRRLGPTLVIERLLSE